jgi:hypothetical protein
MIRVCRFISPQTNKFPTPYSVRTVDCRFCLASGTMNFAEYSIENYTWMELYNVLAEQIFKTFHHAELVPN